MNDYTFDSAASGRRRAGPLLSRFGMAHQVGALVLLSLIVFGAISGLIIRTKYAESLQSDLVSRGENLAKGLADGVQDNFLREAVLVPDHLRQLAKIYGAHYILVYDQQGQIVSHTFDGSIPSYITAAGVHRQGTTRILESTGGMNGEILDIAVPIHSESLSTVRIGMDLDLVERSLENVPVIVWRIVLVSILCAASVAFIVYFLSIRPIYALADAVRQIGRGRFSGSIPIRSRGEWGMLARSVEQMNGDLQRYHRQLKAKTRELEESKEELQRQNEEIKQAQANMIRSEKFASMGQLAASVAHEISNPLAGILTYLKLIRRKLEGGQLMQEHQETYRRYLLSMEKETERCGHIVKNLLDFARSSEPDLREIDVHRVIDDTLFLLNFKLMMRDVRVEKIYDDVPKVAGDFGQLKQVFLNIILNAVEAMVGEDRQIEIRTRHHMESQTVLVEIRDTGEGISEENIYRVFDPFFTTKPRGTGMGLAVVYNLLGKHNGDINIDSEPGKGTKVTVQLNVAEAA
jgi:two-component system NtrC family sensor kinase